MQALKVGITYQNFNIVCLLVAGFHSLITVMISVILVSFQHLVVSLLVQQNIKRVKDEVHTVAISAVVVL